jgi:hypothetical protein
LRTDESSESRKGLVSHSHSKDREGKEGRQQNCSWQRSIGQHPGKKKERPVEEGKPKAMKTKVSRDKALRVGDRNVFFIA